MAPRAMLEPLALAYAFDAVEQDGVLRFRPRGGAPVIELTEDDLVLPEETRAGAADARAGRPNCRARSRSALPTSAPIISAARLPRAGWSAARRRSAHADLAMVTNDSEAERRAEIWLQDLWAGRESAEFALPPSRLALGARRRGRA